MRISDWSSDVCSSDLLKAIHAACRRRGLWLIVDELYHGVTYDRPADTALAAGDDVIVINGFSKFWGMTGWRIGWLVLPERLVPRIEALPGRLQIPARPEERRVGKEGGSTCRSRWSPDH